MMDVFYYLSLILLVPGAFAEPGAHIVITSRTEAQLDPIPPIPIDLQAEHFMIESLRLCDVCAQQDDVIEGL